VKEICCLAVKKLNGVNAQEIISEILKDYCSRNTFTITVFYEKNLDKLRYTNEYIHLRRSEIL